MQRGEDCGKTGIKSFVILSEDRPDGGLQCREHTFRRRRIHHLALFSVVFDRGRKAQRRSGGYGYRHGSYLGRRNRPRHGYYNRPHAFEIRQTQKISALGRYSDSHLIFLPVELVRHFRDRQQDRDDALLHARVYAL